MNLGGLRQEVLAHGFDPTLFGSGRVDQYVNDALNLVARRVDWYEGEATSDFATTAGSSTYPFPADFAKGRSLHDTDRDIELQEVSLLEIDRSSQSQGAPQWYAVDGPNLHLYPVPDGVYNLEFRYWKLPAALVTDADTTTIPDVYQSMLIYWAIHRCYAAEDDLGAAAQWKAKFDEMLAEFAADVRFPDSGFPIQVKGMWNRDEGLSPRGWSLTGEC